MRIGIDGRLYFESGIGRYIRNLVRELQKLDKENKYYIFLLKKDYQKVDFNKNFTKVIADFRWYTIFEQIKFPFLLNKYMLDVVHFPHFNIPIFYRGKFVVTIHDLIQQHFPKKRTKISDYLIYKFREAARDLVLKVSLDRSLRVLTPSYFVRDQLVKYSSLDPEKIVVTYEAVDDKLKTAVGSLTKSRLQRVLEKYSIKPPFIFYLGNAFPHKNIQGLIKAFLSLKKTHQYLKLVLAGQNSIYWQKIRNENYHQDIIFAGQVTDEEAAVLYKSATCFVMPSFEEGFGIPILEAFSCGCPVISSNAGSLPEIGGDAALYFNPQAQDDMVEKISLVLNNAKIRKQLEDQGRARVKLFSFSALAQKTLEVYLKCG